MYVTLDFHSYLLKYLSVATLRESAADCLHEVVSKGTYVERSSLKLS